MELQRSPTGVTTRLVSAIVNYAIGRGVTMEEITAVTGIRRTALIDDESRHRDDVIPKIWQLLDDTQTELSPGLHMVEATSTTIFGPCEHLIRYAANLGEAMHAIERFGKVVADRTEISLLKEASTASIAIWHPMDEVDGGNVAEVGLAMLGRLIEECQQARFLVGVDFAHSPNGTLASYEQFFRVPVRFGQSNNRLHFHRDALDHPMSQADDQLFGYVQANLELIEDRWLIPGERELVSRLFAAAQFNAEQGRFSAEELAITLRVSLRKLQRQAKSHGVTVTSIIEEVRETMAKQLLDDPNNRIDDIASKLDYADDRAFRRAFTRWTAMTPAAYRKQH
ncbi:MAG: AraC family transcriptional regulator ligand-binding domain-containing protein [Planctomycetota bacterium]